MQRVQTNRFILLAAFVGLFISSVASAEAPKTKPRIEIIATGAEGPANLYNAVAVASDPGARDRGVLVVLNDSIHLARSVSKTDTTNVETFRSLNRGPLGVVHTGKIEWFESSAKPSPTMGGSDSD